MSLTGPDKLSPANASAGNTAAELTLSPWRRPFLAGWLLTALALAYYFSVAMHFGPLEGPLFLIGLTALWLPIGGTCYLLLRQEMPDRLDRFTFSALASLSLTTLLYFGFAELHITALFYLLQIGLVCWIVWRLVKQTPHGGWTKLIRSFNEDRFNPTLPLIVAASLLACVKYNTYSHFEPNGDEVFDTYHDNTHHASQGYELARHVPPLQSTIRAGQPERAYHMFPQLTIALIGRYTLQPDLMRANLVYRYTVLEALICLSLFSLGRRLTGSAGGGCLSAALMFIFAIPSPPLMKSSLGYFFFTIYPHVSSLLEPNMVTCCQCVCAIPLVYAMSLGLLQIGGQVRDHGRCVVLPLILALMVAAEMRFRVHLFLPLYPAFLVLMVVFWARSRRGVFPLAVAVSLVVVLLLRLEMRSPAYLRSSSELLIAYNGMSAHCAWMREWPFRGALEQWMLGLLGLGPVFTWSWQVVCLTMFYTLNVCGIPMVVALVAFLLRRRAWTELFPFTFTTLSLLLGSLAGGILLTTTYDSYSVGGEMLLMGCIYGFPIFGAVLWRLLNWFWARLPLTSVGQSRAALALIILGTCAQYAYPRTYLQEIMQTLGEFRLTPAAQGALAFIRDQTPPDSVVASDVILNPRAAIYSGIGGRACYAEYFNYPALDELPGVIPVGARIAMLMRIWQAGSADQLRVVLDQTPINYLIEYSDSPLSVHPASCVRRVWDGADSDGRHVSVWQVIRPEGH